jgi:hypothetical protein
MEWNTTWEDPFTSYVKQFAGLMGDQRTRKIFGEIVKGIIVTGIYFLSNASRSHCARFAPAS